MDETRFQRFLADVGPELADRARSLTGAQRALHQRILGHFADTGQAPSPQIIEEWANEIGIDPRAALASLVEADLGQADPDEGQVLGAYPFVAEPHGHRADIDGGASVQAYCAVDALGIPALLGRDATITSQDPQNGTEIRVAVRGGQASWEPPEAVVTVPADEIAGIVSEGDDQPAADTACPTVNFYASAAAARSYQRAHSLTLAVLTIPQALHLGSAAFGGLLDSTGDHRRS